MAPFAPFLSEHLYQSLARWQASRRNNSVHLCDYPEAEAVKVSPDLRLRLSVCNR